MKKENVYLVNDEDFIAAIKVSKNIHEALLKMNLNSRGAAYKTFNRRVKALNIDISHFEKDNDTRKKITNEEILEACTNSISRQETLKFLRLNPHTGANVSWIKKKIKELNIQTNHWLGEGYLKGKSHKWSSGADINEILIKNSPYLWTSSLKKRLLKEFLLINKCYKCGITHWLGQALSLQLEHINGDNADNRIENLILLCPNCHSLTDTFAGKNVSRSRETRTLTGIKPTCS